MTPLMVTYVRRNYWNDVKATENLCHPPHSWLVWEGGWQGREEQSMCSPLVSTGLIFSLLGFTR